MINNIAIAVGKLYSILCTTCRYWSIGEVELPDDTCPMCHNKLIIEEEPYE